MPRGRGIKRSLGGRGGMSNKGGGGNQQLPNTSQEDIRELSTPTSQQAGSNHHIVSSRESNFQQIVHTSQDASARQTTPALLDVGGPQETPTSLDVDRQQAPSSQNVVPEQANPRDVSLGQTLTFFGCSNPQEQRDTHGGIRSLKVNGDTFCPHEAVRDVSLAFKKSFTGPWHCWSKVPKNVQDKWFNDFENSFTKIIKEKVGETSTLRNEEGLEIDDGDMERNTTTNGEGVGEETSEDNDVNLLKTILKDQLLKTCIETVGGTKKGRIYGLGPKNCLLADSSNDNCASSSAPDSSNVPTQQIFESPEFQQLLERVLEQQMSNMQEYMQADIRENMEAEVNVMVRAAMARILGFTPQPPTNGSGSPPNKS